MAWCGWSGVQRRCRLSRCIASRPTNWRIVTKGEQDTLAKVCRLCGFKNRRGQSPFFIFLLETNNYLLDRERQLPPATIHQLQLLNAPEHGVPLPVAELPCRFWFLVLQKERALIPCCCLPSTLVPNFKTISLSFFFSNDMRLTFFLFLFLLLFFSSSLLLFSSLSQSKSQTSAISSKRPAERTPNLSRSPNVKSAQSSRFAAADTCTLWPWKILTKLRNSPSRCHLVLPAKRSKWFLSNSSNNKNVVSFFSSFVLVLIQYFFCTLTMCAVFDVFDVFVVELENSIFVRTCSPACGSF